MTVLCLRNGETRHGPARPVYFLSGPFLSVSVRSGLVRSGAQEIRREQGVEPSYDSPLCVDRIFFSADFKLTPILTLTLTL